MSRFAQTGTNNIPLGKSRYAGDAPPPPPASFSRDYHAGGPVRRGRTVRTRWDDGDKDNNKALGLIGLTTAIRAHLTIEQLEAYALHLRLEEISQKLRIGDVVPPERLRSPSPAPVYDNYGKRTNTAESRYKKKLEEERHKLVERALKTIPDFRPPPDYRRPAKTQEKIYVPVNDYPEVNFIGLLIGPRGNTLKSMETKSGAKIAIRGKGSVKEGKGRADLPRGANENLDDELHCLVMADTEEKVNLGVKLIQEVITTAASTPEAQNEHKRKQLRDLAVLNGTLRDDENQVCQNCGEVGHRKYVCPKKQNFTATIICHRCGGAGHMARDCRAGPGGPPGGGGGGGYNANTAPLGPPGARRDQDYDNLVRELGGDGGRGGPPGGDGRSGPAPWERQRQIESGPAPWQQRESRHDREDSYRSNGHSNGGRDHYDDRRGPPSDRYPPRKSLHPVHTIVQPADYQIASAPGQAPLSAYPPPPGMAPPGTGSYGAPPPGTGSYAPPPPGGMPPGYPPAPPGGSLPPRKSFLSHMMHLWRVAATDHTIAPGTSAYPPPPPPAGAPSQDYNRRPDSRYDDYRR